MNYRLNIAIDDVHPQRGWRILGDKTEGWLRKLNEEFGAKFTIFIPSNYHEDYPISEHKDWIKELNSIDWLELAAHGHFHQTSDPKRFGECEFAELNNESNIKSRIARCLDEWRECDINPCLDLGWRSPGWLCNSVSKGIIENQFNYVAIHYEHNHGMQWNCKTFFGHDGIQQEIIDIHNGDMIMFQSHIAGNWNHNVWNEHNYEQLRLSLSHLFENYTIEPKLLIDCI